MNLPSSKFVKFEIRQIFIGWSIATIYSWSWIAHVISRDYACNYYFEEWIFHIPEYMTWLILGLALLYYLIRFSSEAIKNGEWSFPESPACIISVIKVTKKNSPSGLRNVHVITFEASTTGPSLTNINMSSVCFVATSECLLFRIGLPSSVTKPAAFTGTTRACYRRYSAEQWESTFASATSMSFSFRL